MDDTDKGGNFYDEFLRDSYIAIGWNYLSKNKLDSTLEGQLREELKHTNYPEKNAGTAIGKSNRFVYNIKSGDVALIVGSNRVAFAIIGEYFEGDPKICTVTRELEVHSQIETNTYPGNACPYLKRRSIQLISEFEISKISPVLFKCLANNHHSLSDLHSYGQNILSEAYDFVYYQNRLIVKIRIQQKKDINPLTFSKFLIGATEVLAIDGTEIVGKYNINSEGNVFLELINNGSACLEFIKNHAIALFLLHVFILGGKYKDLELNSVTKLIEKIVNWKENKRLLEANIKKSEIDVKLAEAELKKKNIEIESEKHLLDAKIKKSDADTKLTEAETRKRNAEAKSIELKNKMQDQLLNASKQISQTVNELDIADPSNNLASIDSIRQIVEDVNAS